MKTKAMLLYILRLGLVLFLITAVVAGLLGLVNRITKDRIAELQAKKAQEAMAAVLPEGASVTEEITDFSDDTGLVQKVTATTDGFVIQVAPSGFGGEISMMVGIDGEGNVSGIAIISHGETAALGANAAADTQAGLDFRGQFVGRNGILAVAKDGGDIDALTGATVTSRAVTQGVNAALQCAAKL